MSNNMHTIKDIINASTILICGHINEENNFEKISYIIQHNNSILHNSKKIVIVLNKSENISDIEFNNIIKLFKSKFKNCIILKDHINRGHQIGYIDLDKIGIFYINQNIECNYITKIEIDFIVDDTFLNLKIPNDIDFYFVPSVCIVDIYDRYDEIIKNHKLKNSPTNPITQPSYNTNIYIIKNKFNDIYESSEEIENCYIKWINSGYKNTSQNTVLCAEHSLSKFIIKHKLSRFCLLQDEDFIHFVNYTKNNNVSDSTLKNIYIQRLGICHWHDKYKPISTIE